MGFQSISIPKRSLGQNYFVNESLGNKIIKYVTTHSTQDTILEIGPGLGFFTLKLSEYFKQLILVEKDYLLYLTLKDRFPNAIIHNIDILEFNYSLIPNHYDVYSSLPYNISKRIISITRETQYLS